MFPSNLVLMSSFIFNTMYLSLLSSMYVLRFWDLKNTVHNRAKPF